MHDEQQRQPDACTQQVLNRVRHIINKKNTQFILDHQHDSLAALSLYLRDCMEDIGHPPARVEVIGGDFLEFRFGSWQKALRSIYDGKAAEFLKNPPSFANRKIVRDLCEKETAWMQKLDAARARGVRTWITGHCTKRR